VDGGCRHRERNNPSDHTIAYFARRRPRPAAPGQSGRLSISWRRSPWRMVRKVRLPGTLILSCLILLFASCQALPGQSLRPGDASEAAPRDGTQVNFSPAIPVTAPADQPFEGGRGAVGPRPRRYGNSPHIALRNIAREKSCAVSPASQSQATDPGLGKPLAGGDQSSTLGIVMRR
jgi:hypothetical protein